MSNPPSPLEAAIERACGIDPASSKNNMGKNAIADAKKFIDKLPIEKVISPHISLASDGEVNFLWALEKFRLDLGFYGDGNYSYYGHTRAGKEFFEDARSISDSLPDEIITLIS